MAGTQQTFTTGLWKEVKVGINHTSLLFNHEDWQNIVVVGGYKLRTEGTLRRITAAWQSPLSVLAQC